MKKKVSANKLYKIITESICKVLKESEPLMELDWRTYQNAALKAGELSDDPNIDTFEQQRRKNQKRDLTDYAIDQMYKQYGVEPPLYSYDKKEGMTQGELRRASRLENDMTDYIRDNAEYKNGKWGTKQQP